VLPIAIRELFPRFVFQRSERSPDRVEQSSLVDRFEQGCDRIRFLDEALRRKVVSAGDQYRRQAAP
jgi:hypothetical protein